jgi:hypothetical protein
MNDVGRGNIFSEENNNLSALSDKVLTEFEIECDRGETTEGCGRADQKLRFFENDAAAPILGGVRKGTERSHSSQIVVTPE